MAEKKNELLKLDEVSFSLDDLLLYLDTHPDDQDALNLYRELCQQRIEAVQEFESKYHPLTKDSEHAMTEGKWTWGDAPLPWEVDANVEL